MSAPTECQECGSTDLEWSWFNRIRNNVAQGRLTTGDVECVFALGCNDCSHTVSIVPAHEVIPVLSSPPLEMRLCETLQVVLKPDQLYRFTVDPDCDVCRDTEERGKVSRG